MAKIKLSNRQVRVWMVENGYTAWPWFYRVKVADFPLFVVEWRKEGHRIGGQSHTPDDASELAYNAARGAIEKGDL